MNRAESGAWAETQACEYLVEQGLSLIERNFRCRLGELDLIMEDDQTLIIVEVRYRQKTGYGTPAETVTRAKRERLLRTARFYLQKNRVSSDIHCRFDVMSISGPNYAPSYQWIRGAFTE